MAKTIRRARGEGELYEYKTSSGIRHGYRIGWKGQRAGGAGFRTRADAARALRDALEKIRRVGKPVEDVLFTTASASYMGWCKTNLHDRTAKERGIIVRSTLDPEFGHLFLSQVGFAEIEAHKSSRLEDVAAPTMNNGLKVLRGIFNNSARMGWIEKEQIPEIMKVKEPKKQPVYVHDEDIPKLFAAMPRRWPRLRYQTLTFTGIRKSDLFRLRLRDVDLKHRLLSLRETENGGPKNDDERFVVLNQNACEAVEEALRLREQAGAKPDDLLFPGRGGRPLKDIRTGLNGACGRAKIPRIHVHGLRSTFGTLVAFSGADLRTIAGALGQRDLRSAEKYMGIAQSRIRSAVESVGQVELPPLRQSKGNAEGKRKTEASA